MKRLEKLQASDYLRDKYDITIQKAVVSDLRPEHFHEFIEIAYIAAGSGWHTINGQEFRIEKGDLFLLGKNTAHKFQAEQELLVYNCIFQPDFIEGALGRDDEFVQLVYLYLIQGSGSFNSRNSYLKLTGTPSEEIQQILEEMLEEYERKEIGYVHLIRSDLVKLLIRVFRQQEKLPSGEEGPSAFSRLMVQNTIAYMEKQFNSEISVGELAAQYYLSASYFSRIFKEITGTTLVAKLQTIRVEKACELLETTTRTVTEIAYDVGYQDMKYFYELFRRQKGISPKQYRKRHMTLLTEK